MKHRWMFSALCVVCCLLIGTCPKGRRGESLAALLDKFPICAEYIVSGSQRPIDPQTSLLPVLPHQLPSVDWTCLFSPNKYIKLLWKR